MIRILLRKIGIVKITLVTTVIAILISIILTTFLLILLKGKVDLAILLIAVIVPAVITPLLTGYLFVVLEQLDQTEGDLQKLVSLDELTGANNRRQFIELANIEITRYERYGNIFSVLMMDVDKFKVINDSFGHQAGDKVLQKLTNNCRSIIRPNDVLARLGGDEFVILLPMTAADEATEMAERIRQHLMEVKVTSNNQQIHFTVSIGVTSFTENKSNLDQVLINADAALYEAKRQGRNKVCLA